MLFLLEAVAARDAAAAGIGSLNGNAKFPQKLISGKPYAQGTHMAGRMVDNLFLRLFKAYGEPAFMYLVQDKFLGIADDGHAFFCQFREEGRNFFLEHKLAGRAGRYHRNALFCHGTHGGKVADCILSGIVHKAVGYHWHAAAAELVGYHNLVSGFSKQPYQVLAGLCIIEIHIAAGEEGNCPACRHLVQFLNPFPEPFCGIGRHGCSL